MRMRIACILSQSTGDSERCRGAVIWTIWDDNLFKCDTEFTVGHHAAVSLRTLTFPSRGNCRDQWRSQPAKTFLVPATVFAACLAPSPTASAASLVSPSLPLSLSAQPISVFFALFLILRFISFLSRWGLTQMCCPSHLTSFIDDEDFVLFVQELGRDGHG